MATTSPDVAADVWLRAAGDRAELVAALDAVAVRVAITRLARRHDWGPHADRVERWCWAAVGDALDDLAAVAPARYGEEAARRHAALLREVSSDLGLPPPAAG